MVVARRGHCDAPATVSALMLWLSAASRPVVRQRDRFVSVLCTAMPTHHVADKQFRIASSRGQPSPSPNQRRLRADGATSWIDAFHQRGAHDVDGFSSVTQTATKLGLLPRCAISLLICGPPPCTTTGCNPSAWTPYDVVNCITRRHRSLPQSLPILIIG